MVGVISSMRIGCEKIRWTIAYMIAAFLFVAGEMPISAYAAETEKQNAVTEDKILEMSSDSKSLNKGDTVDVKFAIHNTETFGFFGYLNYDTDVFENLDAGNILPSDFVPEDETNQGNWRSSYSPSAKSIGAYWENSTKPVIMPDKTQGVVLTVRLVVKKSVDTTKISLEHPIVYKTNRNTDVENYPSGLTITLKNSKIKKLTLTTKDVTASGTMVEVPVSCSLNEGVISLDLLVEFDKTKLSFQSVSIESNLKNVLSVESYSTESGGNNVITHMKASQEIKNIGGLFVVHFTAVKPSGITQTSATLTDTVKLSLINIKDQAESAFEASRVSSTVTVKFVSEMMGDINGNKKIDLVDALYIVQYYNKVRYFTEEQKTVADVNKNGMVDLVDALLLMQYYNGVIKSFP